MTKRISTALAIAGSCLVAGAAPAVASVVPAPAPVSHTDPYGKG